MLQSPALQRPLRQKAGQVAGLLLAPARIAIQSRHGYLQMRPGTFVVIITG